MAFLMRSETSLRVKREYHKRYYAKNRERIIARTSANRRADLERNRTYMRAYYARPVVAEKRKAEKRAFFAIPENFVKKYVREARRRDITWALPDGLAVDLVTDNCFYCGAAPSPVNSIDRVVNSCGYTGDNVVTACKHCNAAKLTRSRDEFETWAVRVATRVGAGKFYPY